MRFYNENEISLLIIIAGTLDYIWISNQFKIEKAFPLPEDPEPAPNADHPSDHFPLVADLLF